ncbi:uncharacterized protein VTP21DRAFT_9710 [Calcarisporiella thermophila]|uniref:uncharacterized protein n=1 Tax=Calcarisporiella thermophila TaxID=911321 RepID=UPI00374313D7
MYDDTDWELVHEEPFNEWTYINLSNDKSIDLSVLGEPSSIIVEIGSTVIQRSHIQKLNSSLLDDVEADCSNSYPKIFCKYDRSCTCLGMDCLDWGDIKEMDKSKARIRHKNEVNRRHRDDTLYREAAGHGYHAFRRFPGCSRGCWTERRILNLRERKQRRLQLKREILSIKRNPMDWSLQELTWN